MGVFPGLLPVGAGLMKEKETAGLAVGLGSQDSCSRRVKFEILLRHTNSGASLTGADLREFGNI